MKKSLVLFCLLCFGIAWGQNGTLYIKPVNDVTPAPGFIALQNHFHKYVDEGVLAGTSMMVEKGNQINWDVYGMQDIEQGIPMAKNTIFRLASMTKPIVSVALMTLVEDGTINLDDEVSQFIPAFKKVKVYRSEQSYEKLDAPITIRHLLSHTGGISSGFDPSPAGKLCQQIIRDAKPASLQELVEALTQAPLSSQPGEGLDL